MEGECRSHRLPALLLSAGNKQLLGLHAPVRRSQSTSPFTRAGQSCKPSTRRSRLLACDSIHTSDESWLFKICTAADKGSAAGSARAACEFTCAQGNTSRAPVSSGAAQGKQQRLWAAYHLNRLTQRCPDVHELSGYVLRDGEKRVAFAGCFVVARAFFLIELLCLTLHALQRLVDLSLVHLQDAQLPLQRILSARHALDLRLERAQRAAVPEDVAVPLGKRARMRPEGASLVLLTQQRKRSTDSQLCRSACQTRRDAPALHSSL